MGLTFRNTDEFKKRLVKSGLVWSRTLSTLLSVNGESDSEPSSCSWTNIFNIFKPELDADKLKNYRRVSNLTFVFKLVERVVALRLVSYFNDQDLMPQLQSAYRRFHSTETAILKVLSDIYCSIDSQHVLLLGLLDCSAAFDCVDHDILLRRLHVRFGICGTVLDWIASFLSSQSQLLQRLQAIQNAATRLITGARRFQHVTPILLLVYKCRHGMAPSYLSTYCIPTSSHDGRCHLCSAVSGQLSVPRTTTNYDDRSFAVSGPVVLNSLPAALRLDMLLSEFRRRLKTFFMTEATDSV